MGEGILGVVLAGGLATRMGGADKGLLSLGHRTILDEVLNRLSSQVDVMIINANGDPARFSNYTLPCVPDSMSGHLGPLAGVLAGLEYARENGFGWIASVAADTPFFPKDFVARARTAADEHNAAVVLASSFDFERSKWMRHPTFGLWHVSLEQNLHDALTDGIRKIVMWTDTVGGVDVRFEHEQGAFDPFFNVNTPDELLIAREGAHL